MSLKDMDFCGFKASSSRDPEIDLGGKVVAFTWLQLLFLRLRYYIIATYTYVYIPAVCRPSYYTFTLLAQKFLDHLDFTL